MHFVLSLLLRVVLHRPDHLSLKLVCRQRFRETVSLNDVTAQLFKGFHLFHVFHAFRNGRQAQRTGQIDYCLEIHGNTLRVEKYAGQEDFSASVTALFEKFRQGEVQDYRHRIVEGPYCDETEEGILQLLAALYPDEFNTLRAFCHEWFRFEEPLLLDFSNDAQFYLRWLDFIKPLQHCGLSFCCPVIRTDKQKLSCNAGFDLALAKQLFDRTVTNDFALEYPERLIVITGPNQGGKTTFTRAFGQMHYLASIGLSVPGKRAELFLCEKILTHFEREEDLSSDMELVAVISAAIAAYEGSTSTEGFQVRSIRRVNSKWKANK